MSAAMMSRTAAARSVAGLCSSSRARSTAAQGAPPGEEARAGLAGEAAKGVAPKRAHPPRPPLPPLLPFSLLPGGGCRAPGGSLTGVAKGSGGWRGLSG
jgi:hypothetical protein